MSVISYEEDTELSNAYLEEKSAHTTKLLSDYNLQAIPTTPIRLHELSLSLVRNALQKIFHPRTIDLDQTSSSTPLPSLVHSSQSNELALGEAASVTVESKILTNLTHEEILSRFAPKKCEYDNHNYLLYVVEHKKDSVHRIYLQASILQDDEDRKLYYVEIPLSAKVARKIILDEPLPLGFLNRLKTNLEVINASAVENQLAFSDKFITRDTHEAEKDIVFSQPTYSYVGPIHFEEINEDFKRIMQAFVRSAEFKNFRSEYRDLFERGKNLARESAARYVDLQKKCRKLRNPIKLRES